MTALRFDRSPAALLAAALCSLVACSEPPPPPLEVKVIVGAGSRISGVFLERSAVVIEGTLIKAAGAQADVPIPAGSTKTDLTGKFLVEAPEPGQPATFTVLACNPEGDPSCRNYPLRHMKDGAWID